MTGSYTIGLDLGTTNCKAVALDAPGSLLGLASSEYRLYTPHSGWGEQRAEDVWAGVLAALSSLAQQIPARAAAGICLSGAMHSSLAVDAAGDPLAPALTWADLRSAAQVSGLRGRCDAHALYLRTGCPLVYLYHPAKLHWWHTQMPEVASRAAAFGMRVIAFDPYVGADRAKEMGVDVMPTLARHGWKPDYVAVRRQSDLQPPAAGDRKLVVLAAARLGRARLIDNVEVNV